MDYYASYKVTSKYPHPQMASTISKTASIGLNLATVISCELTCGSPHALHLHEIKFLPTAASKNVCDNEASANIIVEDGGVILESDGCYTVSASIIPVELGVDICLARLLIKWNRQGLSDIVTSVMATPIISVEQPPITIRVDCPEKAKLGEPFEVSFKYICCC